MSQSSAAKNIRETGSIDRKNGSGRPKHARPAENVTAAYQDLHGMTRTRKTNHKHKGRGEGQGRRGDREGRGKGTREKAGRREEGKG